MLIVLVYKIIRETSHKEEINKAPTNYQKKMSKKLFLRKTKYLRNKADSITQLDAAALAKNPLQVKTTNAVQSRTIVYNRINKAGSGSMKGNK